MKHLPLVLCLFASCGATSCGDNFSEPTQNLFDHAVELREEWLARGLPDINPTCKRLMWGIAGGLTYVMVPQNKLQVSCGSSVERYGCLVGNTIFVDQQYDNTFYGNGTIEHELRHWFVGCSPLGGVDGAHEMSKVWFPYRGRDIREAP